MPSAEEFRAWMGESLSIGDGSTMRVATIVEVVERGSGPPEGPDPFSVLFHVRGDLAGQGNYFVDPPGAERITVFLVPMLSGGEVPDDVHPYEAVFG